MVKNISCKFYEVILNIHAQVSYGILGREYFSAGLFAENKQIKIEGVGCQLKHKKHAHETCQSQVYVYMPS